ncbi:MAG: helix-turn-helix domain-containing protein [Lachnospiraceae bacterium]|nr:helix-turn-helix domain-containing protein [Lachnospiraceae bacterium]
MSIGERIKMRRQELNMSQEELAIKVGYKSRSSINKIELSRNLPLDKVEKVARALDCEPNFLMGWADLNGEPINQPTLTSKIGHLIATNDKDFNTLIDLFLSIPLEKRNRFVDYLKQSAELFRS